jgi:hypothetical protein
MRRTDRRAVRLVVGVDLAQDVAQVLVHQASCPIFEIARAIRYDIDSPKRKNL